MTLLSEFNYGTYVERVCMTGTCEVCEGGEA